MSHRRTLPVRLREIRLETRMAAARTVMRHEADPDSRNEILCAALFPSETVYFVCASARPLLERIAA